MSPYPAAIILRDIYTFFVSTAVEESTSSISMRIKERVGERRNNFGDPSPQRLLYIYHNTRPVWSTVSLCTYVELHSLHSVRTILLTRGTPFPEPQEWRQKSRRDRTVTSWRSHRSRRRAEKISCSISELYRCLGLVAIEKRGPKVVALACVWHVPLWQATVLIKERACLCFLLENVAARLDHTNHRSIIAGAKQRYPCSERIHVALPVWFRRAGTARGQRAGSSF